MRLSLLFAVCLLCLPAVALAGNWTVLPYSQSVMMEVFMVDSKVGYVAGGDNGVGANVLKTTDGGQNWASLPIAPAMMLMAGGAHSESSAIVSGLGLLGPSAQYTKDGKSFTNSSEANVALEQSQASYAISGTSNGYAVVGSWQKFNDSILYNGVAVSNDGGASFKIINTPTEVYARYGAFPTANTWFVTYGEWPSRPDPHVQLKRGIHQISEHLHLRADEATKTLKMHTSANSEAPRKILRDTPKPNGDGYIGQIYKTTDAGLTWTKVFENQTYYLNEISCATERVCYAVGENDGYAFMIKTEDGQNWHEIASYQGMSLFDIQAVSETEFWAGGGVFKFPVEGHAFHSTDGGRTIEDTIVPDNYLTSVSFIDGEHGWATSIDTAQQSGLLQYA